MGVRSEEFHQHRTEALARIDERRLRLQSVIAASETVKRQSMAASSRALAAQKRARAAMDRARAASCRADLNGFERELAADERDRVADERDRIADERDLIADRREAWADSREAPDRAEPRAHQPGSGRLTPDMSRANEERAAKVVYWREVTTRTRLRTAEMAELIAEAADIFASILEESAARGDDKRREQVAGAEREIARIGRRNAARLREGRTEYGMIELEHLPRLPI